VCYIAFMSPIAALSPDESNWGEGGLLSISFLCLLASPQYTYVHIYMYMLSM
jgi:hypothetical protein